MTFASNVIGLWKFDGDFNDEVYNNSFVLNHEDPYFGISVPGSFGTFLRYNTFEGKDTSVRGLILNDDASYAADHLISGSFTVAFWYKSPDPIGFTRHVVTKSLEPKTAPIIGIGNNSTDGTSESISDCSFVILEQGFTEDQNRIVVLISYDGGQTTQFISEPYSPGLHLILVTYHSVNQQIRIDIDGHPGEWEDLDSTIFVSMAGLRINELNPNYIEHQATELSRIISELYIKNTSANEYESSRFYVYGIDYVTDSQLINVDFSVFPILIEQPSTITTNKIVPEGSNIYITRSDGSLLKGSQKIWDIELQFVSAKKNNLLKYNTGSVTFTTEGAKIKGATVTT